MGRVRVLRSPHHQLRGRWGPSIIRAIEILFKKCTWHVDLIIVWGGWETQQDCYSRNMNDTLIWSLLGEMGANHLLPLLLCFLGTGTNLQCAQLWWWSNTHTDTWELITYSHEFWCQSWSECKEYMESEWEKVWSRLSAHLQPFFWLIARILTIFDKKYPILTCCDKRESYLIILQQNNV